MHRSIARFLRLLAAAACLATASPSADTRASIDLNGKWQFRTDPQDAGRIPAEFTDTVSVPGCWQAQGIGEPTGILRHHYAGPAWYRKTVAVPSEWKGRRVTLRIGGALRDVQLFVNGAPAGSRSGMSAPFEFDVTDAVRPGAENVLVLRVSIPKDWNSTAHPEKQTGAEPTGMLNYMGNWGGLYGNVSLESAPATWIDHIAITPDVARMVARFRVTVHSTEPARTALLRLRADKYEASAPIEIRPGQAAEKEIDLPMPGARLWSPDHPSLYTAEIALAGQGADLDRTSQRFGLRQVTTRGDVLLLNGKPLYLRAFGDDNIEVLTGTPPASKQVYLDRLRLAKSYGFNGVRFHSLTPVPEYFEAADETGILVMAELPAAYTMYFLPHKEFLRNELTSILRAHRNHPSLLSIAFGNELNPEWIKDDAHRKEFFETIAEFYRLAKSIDPARIVMSNDGNMVRPTDMASLGGGTAKDVPTVRHEFGNYYCSLPDISLIDKFTGVVEPTWLKDKKRWVEENGLAAAYPIYLEHSRRLQQLGWKYQIEKVRLDPEVTGYDYWLIVDYPAGTGEGDSWEEGWFDYFWRPKGLKPEQGRELNSAVLPLIDAGPGDRTFWADTGKTIGVLVSNYGEDEIRAGTLSWKLTSQSASLQSGHIPDVHVALGKLSRIGEIAIRDLPQDEARQLQLVVELKSGQSVFTNRWNFWSYPRPALLKQSARPVFSTVKWSGIERIYPFITERSRDWNPKGVVVTSALNRDATAFLEAGGTVLLLADHGRPIRYFPEHGGALGTSIPDHPAFRGFPHAGFSDLQFYNLIDGAGSVTLNRLGKGTEPILGAVMTADAWLSAKKDLVRTAQLFEARAGKGRLLATTLRVRENFDEAFPEVIYFFDRLLRYAVSDEFDPKAEIGSEQLANLVRE